jgi:eukaryotic-like serine/threonine-protein kinase
MAAPMSSVNSADALDRLLGTTVAGKYRVERLLGRGGMGAVFQATNTAIGKRVALKFLIDGAADDQAAQRFQREAEAASLVESEHIVQIFDSGSTDDGLPFLVMELLQGEDLRHRLKSVGKLAPAEAAGITLQLLRALVRAHAAGIVHRDLKPDNVFLCERDGGGPLVKIVDFGISKLSRKTTLDTLTQRGTILGTAFYMSPEQAQGLEEVDARADLYSVGALFYEMLAGRPPHTAATYEAVLVAICTRDSQDVRAHESAVPEAYSRVLHKALARDRELRHQTAAEMLRAVEGALAGRFEPGTDTAALSLPPRLATAESAARRRTLVAAIMALLFGFGITALLLARSRQGEAALPPPQAPSLTAVAEPLAALPAEQPAAVASAEPEARASSAPPPAKPSTRPKGAPAVASSKRTTGSATPSSGVAGSLKLNTSGP